MWTLNTLKTRNCFYAYSVFALPAVGKRGKMYRIQKKKLHAIYPLNSFKMKLKKYTSNCFQKYIRDLSDNHQKINLEKCKPCFISFCCAYVVQGECSLISAKKKKDYTCFFFDFFSFSEAPRLAFCSLSASHAASSRMSSSCLFKATASW